MVLTISKTTHRDGPVIPVMRLRIVVLVDAL